MFAKGEKKKISDLTKKEGLLPLLVNYFVINRIFFPKVEPLKNAARRIKGEDKDLKMAAKRIRGDSLTDPYQGKLK